jgi:hypothetical protein
VPHPAWTEGEDWDPLVTCGCATTGDEVLLLDPLLPAQDDPVMARIEDARPTRAVILKPDHVRDVDAVVERWGIPAHGPWLFWRDDVPQTDLIALEPETELPGGAVALHDPRGKMETPLWLPEQRTIVFADALAAMGGELRVWWTRWHETRTLPALRALLELPFEHVVVAHGDPVHDRAAFERALGIEPWGTPTLA